MTREHKLALILGFALVLVVGVLVSDHISGSQRGVASTQSMDDPIRAIEAELGPGLGQATARSQDRVLPGLPLPEATEQLASRETATDSGIINGFIDAIGRRVEDIRDTPPPVAGQTERTPASEPGVILMGRPVVPDPIAANDASRSTSPSGDDPDSSVRFHRVADSETLWAIAERYYGDGNLHAKLAAWNTELVGSRGTIRPGTNLVIPSRALLDSEITSGGGEVVRQDPPRNEAPTTQKPTQTPKTWVYVVKRGDSLSKIAQRELGTVKRMDEILKLNTDKVSSADEIWVGLELRMPAR